MKKTIVSLLLVVASQLSITEFAFAQEVRYISDELRVPLRTTPSNRGKIIHFGLPAGTKLNVIEENEDGWSHVTTGNDLEGWLPSQYLVQQQVARMRIGNVEKEVANLKTKASELNQSLSVKEAEVTELQQQLNQLTEENGTVRQELTEIKQISSDAVNIHEQNMELAKENKLLQGEVNRLTAANDQLKSDERFTWFMYGSLAVLLGVLLAIVVPRLRPKRRYTEWG
ncbi:TIGR04211 family SH3 domain-containing protein [Porticoccaceae bacterium LTM1]|nr:TIGR04211 family SH3 domain-containing protein [Porticoccaceae bacterium LTM1]